MYVVMFSTVYKYIEELFGFDEDWHAELAADNGRQNADTKAYQPLICLLHTICSS